MCIRNSYNIHVCQNIAKLRIMYIFRYVYADPSQRTLKSLGLERFICTKL